MIYEIDIEKSAYNLPEFGKILKNNGFYEAGLEVEETFSNVIEMLVNNHDYDERKIYAENRVKEIINKNNLNNVKLQN